MIAQRSFGSHLSLKHTETLEEFQSCRGTDRKGYLRRLLRKWALSQKLKGHAHLVILVPLPLPVPTSLNAKDCFSKTLSMKGVLVRMLTGKLNPSSAKILGFLNPPFPPCFHCVTSFLTPLYYTALDVTFHSTLLTTLGTF